MASGDCLSIYVYNLYNKTPMNTFPHLRDAEIDQLLAYIDNESRLIDSNTIPDYKKQYDSRVLYNRLADSLTQRRVGLIGDNGQRTDVIRGDTSGKRYTGTYIPPAGVASVDVVQHPAIYYKMIRHTVMPSVSPSTLIVVFTLLRTRLRQAVLK
jgi:hypothetical protein